MPRLLLPTIFHFIPELLREKNVFTALTWKSELGILIHKPACCFFFFFFTLFEKPTATMQNYCITASRRCTARLKMLAEELTLIGSKLNLKPAVTSSLQLF